MSKKILTLDNLYQFFVQQNQAVNFSAKESGKPIVVSIPGHFELAKDDMPGMLQTTIKVCHTELNRNGSFISEDNMLKAMPTLKYRPILAHIHQTKDGVWDFYAHNIEIVENENGEEEIVYIENQVGCFTADEPYLKYDEKQDKTYVMANAVIPEEYTKAADIIRRKNGTKVSCELVINELSYNAKEKYLDLTDFYFGGCTLLGCDEEGTEIGEGMLGARLDITDFCHKEPTFNYQDKLLEILEKLDFTLSSFNDKNLNKGGGEAVNKFEELLQKYGKTTEDITFEIEGLSDEELEAKFEEVFGEVTEPVTEDPTTEGAPASEGDEGDPVVEPVADPVAEEPVVTEPVVEETKFTKVFTIELSHEDIHTALYNLIAQYEEADGCWYFIREVFDDYFYMQSWSANKMYKQSYKVDGENVSLEGDRQEVFEIIVTESEKIAIEKLREDYSALEVKYNELAEFKANYDAAQLKAQKEAILAKAEYECLKENEEFVKLVNEMDNYSVEELSVKADLLFAAHVKAEGTFSAKPDGKPAPKFVGINFNAKEKKKSPYGNLFAEK